MKKARVLLACLALALAFGGLTGCMLPDYQLDMNVYVSSSTGGTTGPYDSATITYEFTNVGTRDLSNVQVEIEAWRIDESGEASIITHTLGPFSISSGSMTSGTEDFIWSNDGEDSSFDVFVTSVGWDADD
jgi:hypothetical protein